MQNKTIQKQKTLPRLIRLLAEQTKLMDIKMLVDRNPCYALYENSLYFFNGTDKIIGIETSLTINEIKSLFPRNYNQAKTATLHQLEQLNRLISHYPLQKYIETQYKNRFNAFCSINNDETNRLPSVLVNHIGTFFIPSQNDCIKLARQRKESLKLQQLLLEFQNNKTLDLLTLCKQHLLNGAQFIGPRHKNVKFCIENMNLCFPDEKTWPSQVQALIYLQVYIQQEKNSCLLTVASAIKNECLGIQDDRCYIVNDQSFLGKIYLLCQQSGLIEQIIEEENHQCSIQ